MSERTFFCEVCKYWQPDDEGTKVGHFGDCRIQYPIFPGEFPWPRTEAKEWCIQGSVDEDKLKDRDG